MQDLTEEQTKRVEELKDLLITEAIQMECDGVCHNSIKEIDGKKYKATFLIEEVA